MEATRTVFGGIGASADADFDAAVRGDAGCIDATIKAVIAAAGTIAASGERFIELVKGIVNLMPDSGVKSLIDFKYFGAKKFSSASGS